MQFIQILTAFFAIVFTFLLLSFVGQAKMTFRSLCLTESIELQKKIIRAEKLLFSFNAYSTFLSSSRRTLEISLASGTLPPPVAIAVKAKIQALKILQQALDKTQKSLIHSTNLLIKAEKIRITAALFKSTGQSRQQWSHYLNSVFIVTPRANTSMSVEPTSSELAPNYGLTNDYKQAQTVAFHWHLAFYTNNDSQRFVDSRKVFELSCGTMPDKENSQWSVEIKKDKY